MSRAFRPPCSGAHRATAVLYRRPARSERRPRGPLAAAPSGRPRDGSTRGVVLGTAGAVRLWSRATGWHSFAKARQGALLEICQKLRYAQPLVAPLPNVRVRHAVSTWPPLRSQPIVVMSRGSGRLLSRNGAALTLRRPRAGRAGRLPKLRTILGLILALTVGCLEAAVKRPV